MTIKYESTSFLVYEFSLIEQLEYWQRKYEETFRQLQDLMIKDLGNIVVIRQGSLAED